VSTTVLDVLGEPIDPIWAAEFRGFFWGEGHFGAAIIRERYRIHAVVGLRADDEPALRDFQRRLGGSLSWHVAGRYLRLNFASLGDCQRVAALLADGADTPFQKRKQLAPWTEMLAIKAAAGGTTASRYTPEQHARMRDLVTRIRSLRRWDE